MYNHLADRIDAALGANIPAADLLEQISNTVNHMRLERFIEPSDLKVALHPADVRVLSERYGLYPAKGLSMIYGVRLYEDVHATEGEPKVLPA